MGAHGGGGHRALDPQPEPERGGPLGRVRAREAGTAPLGLLPASLAAASTARLHTLSPLALQVDLGVVDDSARAALRDIAVSGMAANLAIQTCAAFDPVVDPAQMDRRAGRRRGRPRGRRQGLPLPRLPPVRAGRPPIGCCGTRGAASTSSTRPPTLRSATRERLRAEGPARALRCATGSSPPSSLFSAATSSSTAWSSRT